ncbi:MAG: M1 family metallopeptidase [Thermoanaerobaculia bacterium]
MTRIDPHSYFDDEQPRVRHLRLRWNLDFDRKEISGDVTLVFAEPCAGPLDLDSKGLTIRSVTLPDGTVVPHMLADEEPILGQRLRLDLPAATKEARISYCTSPDAIALQWLTPAQTEGKQHPFLFSQCQAIHARSIIPLQDSPRARVTYEAEVNVPAQLSAVMSAGPAGEKREGDRHTFLFSMPQPIPPYLLAIAAGNLASRDVSSRVRVWAEPESVEDAAWEFGKTETMITTAEALFGPYEWDRYDMLILPPSFPYGGMENPRITFLTPTVIAGDRSLVDVVAHELAHSWTGNLVTNATMDHFWLNEGFTTWAERRILEALHGEEVAILGWAIGQNALDTSVERFGADSPLTRLRTDLEGIDPDDAFSSIPYEKGARFAVVLEREAGREKFDRFMRAYMEHFRFTSITSEEFIGFLEEKMPGLAEKAKATEWLYGTGMPDNAPVFRSATLERLTKLAEGWAGGERPSDADIENWDTRELLVYLQHLPRQMDRESLDWLDQHFDLTSRGNYEILAEWLTIAAGSDYEPVFDRLREVLTRVGRMKYLRPLFLALGRHARTRKLAHEIFDAAKTSYHSLSRRVIEGVMEKYPAE